MPVEDYCHLLHYIVEAAGSRASFDAQGIASFVRLLKVVGLNSPEGTSKLTQQAFSKTLVSCADRPNYVLNSATRAEVLALLNGFCSDRPASVRPSDISTIWSIIGQLLSSSLEHDQATDPTVFQEIVSIVSALVRLRRDLVLNTLPHLGMVLRRLINALKEPRPQLGAKQTRLVMNTLPAWISAEKPLSAEEARVLARLMTTLTTKTIVRMHGQNAESQKPESLVRPFSKHAAYVLTAYIDAVNDPLCHVATQIRKELQPGLFALCDMLGDHNRDAMMVSALDASGKVMMKALWKEYEKQRYVGKG
ncbi:hypothetical protein DAEQUDRAFT_8826 [Daedalea quercina L-15889]|uniref:Nucleolar 27S pre-rRNA processing Urb2/Npa2 C-terminal domain-containing protein n=1 Tax=Daedalea quercina L-15889 TaxID=1314783 RepID=A0A165UFI1_9APHY|nr:hypothetical protein DAEQUDRAFT_8826 [Daedalea quercina L-15889]